jgi:hypothetical protein
VPAPRPPITGATRSGRATPTAVTAAASGTASRRRRSAHSPPMRSASTTWPAICRNGCRIVIMVTTREHPRIVRRGPVKIVVAVSFAAVPGMTFHSTSARPTVSGRPPASGSTTTGSVSGGRLPLESLPLLLPRCSFQRYNLAPHASLAPLATLTPSGGPRQELCPRANGSPFPPDHVEYAIHR